jgi:hypothetical protein
MTSKLSPALLTLLALAGAPGCTVFSDYGSSTEDARAMFERGDFKGSYKLYAEDFDATNDGLLYRLEAGQVAHVGEDFTSSINVLTKASDDIVDYQHRALTTDILQNVGSMVANEKTISYTGSIFEQILVQTYLAMDHFLAGNRDRVLPEILRCYEVQDKAREIYQEELKHAEAEATSQRQDAELDMGMVNTKLHEAYDYGDLSDAESVYQINYVRYVNAWLREANADHQDDYNSAWIDLQYLGDSFGDVEFIRRDLIRLAEASGDVTEARAMRKQYGLPKVPGDHGSVTLFFESGMAPRLEEFGVIFPTYKGAAKVAVPVYKPVPNPVAGAVLILGEHQKQTTTLSNLETIAFRYHSDRMPLIIAKMVVRLIIKIGLQSGGTIAIEQATKGTEHEGWGQLAALGWSAVSSAWNVISEQADLRCWRTLPQTMQATRLFLPEGSYPAKLALLNAGGGTIRTVDLGTIEVRAGKHRMVKARSLGSNAYYSVPAEPYDQVAAAGPESQTRNVLEEGAQQAPVETTTREVLQGE